jgi:hypothetical protein
LVGQREKGRDRAEGVVPRRITDSVGRRLERLSPDAARAARAGAVLDSTSSVGELASLLALAPVDLIDPVDELLRSDVLIEHGDRLTFRHDLLRDGILNALLAAELGGAYAVGIRGRAGGGRGP